MKRNAFFTVVMVLILSFCLVLASCSNENGGTVGTNEQTNSDSNVNNGTENNGNESNNNVDSSLNDSNNSDTANSDTTNSDDDNDVTDESFEDNNQDNNENDENGSGNNSGGDNSDNSNDETDNSGEDNTSGETGDDTDNSDDIIGDKNSNENLGEEVVDAETGHIFRLSYDGNYYVFTGYDITKCPREIVVPYVYKNKPVKAIGEGTFDGLSGKITTSNSSQFYKVLIPKSVEWIGKGAFNECNNIKAVLYRVKDSSVVEIIDQADIYEWILNVTVKEENNNFIEVVGQIRPAFGWGRYTNATLYVSLNADGGVVVDANGNEINSLLLKFKPYSLPTPTKDGCEFEGWYYGDIKVEMSGNKWEYFYIELTARWSEK